MSENTKNHNNTLPSAKAMRLNSDFFLLDFRAIATKLKFLTEAKIAVSRQVNEANLF